MLLALSCKLKADSVLVQRSTGFWLTVTSPLDPGCCRYDDELSSFSNYGANTVEVAAPGEGLLTTLSGGAFDYVWGTSMAAPVVRYRRGRGPFLALSAEKSRNEGRKLVVACITVRQLRGGTRMRALFIYKQLQGRMLNNVPHSRPVARRCRAPQRCCTPPMGTPRRSTPHG